MLYVTTRNNQDIFTTHRALTEMHAPDGGLYLPFRMPCFSADEIRKLSQNPFNQRMAELLNILFRTRLTGWDIDFSVGRYPVRVKNMSHRILMGESWHNPGWTFDWMAGRLSANLRCQVEAESDISNWTKLAVRIAVLFGLVCELQKNGSIEDSERVDVAVESGDLSGAMAARYARDWGLPIGNIVICTNENAFMWDLLHKGELRTGAVAVATTTPLCDLVIPDDLERLVHAAGGPVEVNRFLDICGRGGLYQPSDSILQAMNDGIYVSVVSEKRMLSAIPNLYRSNGYIASPYAAMCHSGLQDYRARTGESRPALVISERSPVCDAETVSAAMGITPAELKKRINRM